MTAKVDGQTRVPFARVYHDSNGRSHFSDGEVLLRLTDYAPPAAPFDASSPMGARSVTFLSLPAGWFGDWHPAPRRQFAFCLSGEYEVEVSNGERRRFPTGSVLLVEDTEGKGHITRVVSPGPAILAAVPLAE